MIRELFYLLRGSVVTFLLFLNLLSFPIFTILSAFFAWCLPTTTLKYPFKKLTQLFPRYWFAVNNLIISISNHNKWVVQGTDSLDPRGWYLLMANHQSWADIFVLGYVFNRKIPLLKFFLKKELLWTLPIAGFACKAAGYPFMQRQHSKEELRKNSDLRNQDLETAKKSCELFKEFPCTMMNFVESTRFTTEKQKKQTSPYQHLLKPKSGGLAVVLTEMSSHLTGIIDATIHYSEQPASLWHFICGKIKKVTVLYELLPVQPELMGDYYNDREFRKNFTLWLNQRWDKKEKQLAQLNT